MNQERSLGPTEEHLQVNALLLALSRTCRAFRLYDPRNELIRGLLKDLRDRFKSFGESHGALALEIDQYTIRWNEEDVYQEADRERSLAFRLFRDGVRGLEVQADVPWDELVSLLEVLSIRYVGVRQGEHDLVTLLRAADFQYIQVHAVEGALDAAQPRSAGKGYHVRQNFEAPEDFDIPLPMLENRAEVAWKPLDYDVRQGFVAELAPERIPELSLILAHQLLAAARDPEDPTRIEELADLLGEFRDFLLIERRYIQARTLYTMLGQAFAKEPERVAPLRASFHGHESIRRILRGALPGTTEPSQELITYLRGLKAPGPIAEGVVRGLALERAEESRSLAVALLRQLIPHFHERLRSWFLDADEVVRKDLADASASSAPGVCLAVVGELGNVELLIQALHALRDVQDSAELTAALLALLSNPVREVRLHVVLELADRTERSAFDPMLELMEKRAAEMDEGEARAVGRALAHLLPDVAADEFHRWLKLSGVMSRLVKTREQRMLEWAAVCGLEIAGSPRFDRDLLDVARRERRGPLYELCQSVLVERRRQRREKSPRG